MSLSLSVTGVAASPAMRGSTPLDVAASSVMDNNGLALALEEPDLDKVGPCFSSFEVILFDTEEQSAVLDCISLCVGT